MSGPYVSDWPIGRTVVALRAMSAAEFEAQMWDDWELSGAIVIEFDDGSTLFPSRDAERNGPGEFFGVDPLGAQVVLYPMPDDE